MDIYKISLTVLTAIVIGGAPGSSRANEIEGWSSFQPTETWMLDSRSPRSYKSPDKKTNHGQAAHVVREALLCAHAGDSVALAKWHDGDSAGRMTFRNHWQKRLKTWGVEIPYITLSDTGNHACVVVIGVGAFDAKLAFDKSLRVREAVMLKREGDEWKISDIPVPEELRGLLKAWFRVSVDKPSNSPKAHRSRDPFSSN